MNREERFRRLALVCRWLGDALAAVLVVLAIAAYFAAEQDQLELALLILVPAAVCLCIGRAGAYMIYGFGKVRGTPPPRPARKDTE